MRHVAPLQYAMTDRTAFRRSTRRETVALVAAKGCLRVRGRVCVCVWVGVGVCDRERERERGGIMSSCQRVSKWVLTACLGTARRREPEHRPGPHHTHTHIVTHTTHCEHLPAPGIVQREQPVCINADVGLAA